MRKQLFETTIQPRWRSEGCIGRHEDHPALSVDGVHSSVRSTVRAVPRRISDLRAASGDLVKWPLYDGQRALVNCDRGIAIAAKPTLILGGLL